MNNFRSLRLLVGFFVALSMISAQAAGKPVRYTLLSEGGNTAFVEFVSAEIALSGYALHGFNVAFEQRRATRQ